MKNSRKSFWSGVLFTLLVVSLATPALAAVGKTIQVSTGIQIFVDGEKMEPKDSNGNPVETFIYNGTTYVPLRAVSQYLGKTVRWDGDTRSVYIGEVPGEQQTLMDVCPPYQSDHFEELSKVNVAGTEYKKTFRLGRDSRGTSYVNSYGGWALFNLNGQYNALSFDIGHIDGQRMERSNLNIFLDGEEAFSVELNPEMLPTHYEVPLHGALQMKIETGMQGGFYSFINAEIK